MISEEQLLNSGGGDARAPAGQGIVVFTGDLSYTVRRNIVDLDQRVPGLRWLVLVHSPRRKLSQVIKGQRANLRKHGWRWLAYQLTELPARFFGSGSTSAGPDAPGAEYELEALQARGNVQVCRVADIHAASSLALVQQFAPRLGLSLAAPILKAPLFALPSLGTINLHKGRLPDFRGMPPAFWELWTGQSSVGCSVHRVNERLDEGELLAEDSLACERYSTQRGLQIRLDEIGSELVCDVAVQLLEGKLAAVRQVGGEGKTWRKPTLAQQTELRQRLAARDPHARPRWLRLLKEQLAKVEFAWHDRLAWHWRAPRVTVLLFHRVCDDARDNLSVGVEQFERQMGLLRRHCEVLSIEQVLTLGEIPRSRRPLVAVSFDDGYLDNFRNAAPILRRQRVPCSFYVSTGIVASDQRFPHDQRRGNAAIPTMDWAQLRALRAWGFTIGSHTVNHVDCVAEPESLVREELDRSRDDLQRELGPLSPIFAYPYGGRHQMNEARLTLVRDAGYQACLAAYGGSNIGRIDRWNLLRRGIHWEFTDAAFLRQCLGR